MSNLSRLRDLLTPGTILTCVENTFSPRRNGAMQVVQELHANRVICKNEYDVPVTVYLPVRETRIDQINERTFRWPLKLDDGDRRLNGHHVTYLVTSYDGELQ